MSADSVAGLVRRIHNDGPPVAEQEEIGRVVPVIAERSSGPDARSRWTPPVRR